MLFPVGELFLIYVISEIITGIVMGTLICWSAPYRDSLRRGPFGTGVSLTLVGLLAVGPPTLLRVVEFGLTPIFTEIVVMWAVFITATVLTLWFLDKGRSALSRKKRY